MSLELALQENTNTMKQLIAAWNALTSNATKIKAGESFNASGVPIYIKETATVDSTEPRSPEADHKAAMADVAARRTAEADQTTVATHLAPGKATAKVAAPKPVVVTQPTETAAAKPVSEPEASPPAPSIATVTYEDVRTLVLQVSKEKGRDVAAAVLALFGVAKAPELKPEQYADAVAHFKSELRV